MISRNQEHFIIMTVIYDELTDFTYGNKEYIRDAKFLMSELSELPYENVSPFVKNMVSYCLNNYGKIKNTFNPHLVRWKWERLPLLTQSILLMSYAHYFESGENVDKKVVIDVAVRLAKEYIEEKQAKFINAILDEVLKND